MLCFMYIHVRVTRQSIMMMSFDDVKSSVCTMYIDAIQMCTCFIFIIILNNYAIAHTTNMIIVLNALP